MNWSEVTPARTHSIFRPGIDLVVRDLEYHVIGLKTQCLWVTYIPIPCLQCIHLKW